MARKVNGECGTPKSASASGVVVAGPCGLLGVFCTASTSAVLKIFDNTAASGTVVADQFTLTAGSFYRIPAACANGIYVQLVSGTGTWSTFHQQ